MKILMVLNPVSGGNDKTDFVDQAEKFCTRYGIGLKLFETTGKDDHQKLEKQIGKLTPDRVIAAGGDGTILLAAKVLSGSDTPLGIVPLGSANGLAADLFVPPDPLEAFKEAVISQIITGIDMLEINDEYHAIHIGDVGVNARIVDAYSKDENRGLTTYAKHFIGELRRIEPFEVKVKTTGKTVEETCVMVAICNARKYGTGIPVNINGNPMDGEFEIVIIKSFDLNTLIRAGLASFDERFHDSQNSIDISTDHATIEFDRPRLLQLDGEVIGKFEKLDIKILKSAVRLVTHNDNEYLRNL